MTQISPIVRSCSKQTRVLSSRQLGTTRRGYHLLVFLAPYLPAGGLWLSGLFLFELQPPPVTKAVSEPRLLGNRRALA